jgi:hypothetical protein
MLQVPHLPDRENISLDRERCGSRRGHGDPARDQRICDHGPAATAALSWRCA